MTFLELVRALQREAGVAGDPVPTVTDQTGEFGRLVSWVANAWEELQMESRDWSFMWGEFVVPLDAGYNTFGVNPEQYGTLPILSPGPFYLILGDGQVRYLRHLETQFFFERFNTRSKPGLTTGGAGDFTSWSVAAAPSFPTGSQAPAEERGLPTIVTVLPDRRVRFDVALVENMQLSGRYRKKVQTLATDGDIPQMPDEYHKAILYRALLKYADFEEALQLRGSALEHGGRWENAMVRDLKPKIMVGSQPLEGSPFTASGLRPW